MRPVVARRDASPLRCATPPRPSPLRRPPRGDARVAQEGHGRGDDGSGALRPRAQRVPRRGCRACVEISNASPSAASLPNRLVLERDESLVLSSTRVQEVSSKSADTASSFRFPRSLEHLLVRPRLRLEVLHLLRVGQLELLLDLDTQHVQILGHELRLQFFQFLGPLVELHLPVGGRVRGGGVGSIPFLVSLTPTTPVALSRFFPLEETAAVPTESTGSAGVLAVWR